MKKVWKKPELVVLVRGKPEEAVLQACKGGLNTGGPDISFAGCHTEYPELNYCRIPFCYKMMTS